MADSVFITFVIIIKCIVLILMCTMAIKTFYQYKGEVSGVCYMFILYCITIIVMLIYEMWYHQIIVIYYTIWCASFGQVFAIYFNIKRVNRY